LKKTIHILFVFISLLFISTQGQASQYDSNSVGLPTMSNNKLTIPRIVVTGTEDSDGLFRIEMDWNPGTKQFKIIPDTYIPSDVPFKRFTIRHPFTHNTATYSVSSDIATLFIPFVKLYFPDKRTILKQYLNVKLRHIDDGTPYGAFIIEAFQDREHVPINNQGPEYPEFD
jgi:hypothetical protein